MKFSSLINSEDGNAMMVIGAGGSLRDYKERICDFVVKDSVSTIGVNRMTDVLVPKYHLWTNSGRFREYHSCINDLSVVIFGSQMKPALIKRHYPQKHIIVDYRDEKKLAVSYKRGVIRGFFRTAGCLSILMCHLLGAKKIYVVGMDGYTFYSKSAVTANQEHQHVYGSGLSDGTDWSTCQEKDNIVYRVLRSLKSFGAEFSIITPTVFTEFYTPFPV